jgi:hypothetical protein
MGMIKKAPSTQEVKDIVTVVEKKPESGVEAAVARLQTPKEAILSNIPAKLIDKVLSKESYPGEDKKNERILRQGVYQHALISPTIASMKWTTPDEFVGFVSDIAEKVIAKIRG